jgi:hypothetical protein
MLLLFSVSNANISTQYAKGNFKFLFSEFSLFFLEKHSPKTLKTMSTPVAPEVEVAATAEVDVSAPEQEQAVEIPEAEHAVKNVAKNWHDVVTEDHAVKHMKLCEAEGRMPVQEMVEKAHIFLQTALDKGVVFAAPGDNLPPTVYYAKVRYDDVHGKPIFETAGPDYAVPKEPEDEKKKQEFIKLRIE